MSTKLIEEDCSDLISVEELLYKYEEWFWFQSLSHLISESCPGNESLGSWDATPRGPFAVPLSSLPPLPVVVVNVFVDQSIIARARGSK